jgi:hypothetical protein
VNHSTGVNHVLKLVQLSIHVAQVSIDISTFINGDGHVVFVPEHVISHV